MYGFEPDYSIYSKTACQFANADEKIKLFNVGLYDKAGTNKLSGVDGSISTKGEFEIHTDRLDDLVHDKITFIKMDIEGSEYKALVGAENTIKTNKPKLAICLYHKPQDLWEIPLLVHNMVPEYKLYIRNITHMILCAKL